MKFSAAKCAASSIASGGSHSMYALKFAICALSTSWASDSPAGSGTGVGTACAASCAAKRAMSSATVDCPEVRGE